MEQQVKANREELTALILRTLEAHQIHDFREHFLQLHPTDQVGIITSLTKKQRHMVYKFLAPAEFAEIFQGLDVKHQKQYFSEMTMNYAVDVINNMYSDDLADFLAVLPEAKKELLLSKMNQQEAQEVQYLLKYPEQTAGAIMTTEYISISVTNSVSEVLNQLRLEGPDAETVYYLYVTDNRLQLVGVVSLRDLIISPLETRIEAIMSTRIVAVDVNDDQEEVAHVIQNYDFLAVPVTDQGKLVGIVTVDDIIDVLEEEVTEDFGDITASRGTVDLEIGPVQAAKKRIPWLLILLVIGLGTAGIISQFEETLEKKMILGFFIPLIAGMAGNTGTQSLAVVVRGLALGKIDRSTVGKLLKRELLTGLMIGLVCGITLAFISQVLARDLLIGFIIGFSLFITLIVATLAGSIVPLIINKLKIDPAVASGPFITTINDLVALLIYFSIATALLTNIG
jgi:magnesium transporter